MFITWCVINCVFKIHMQINYKLNIWVKLHSKAFFRKMHYYFVVPKM